MIGVRRRIALRSGPSQGPEKGWRSESVCICEALRSVVA